MHGEKDIFVIHLLVMWPRGIISLGRCSDQRHSPRFLEASIRQHGDTPSATTAARQVAARYFYRILSHLDVTDVNNDVQYFTCKSMRCIGVTGTMNHNWCMM